MSHDRHTQVAARSKRRNSRYVMVLASAAFVSGVLALPASAAMTPETRPSVTTDTPGTDQGTPATTKDGCDVPECGGNATGDDPEQNREPGGGAYGPATCKQGYVWRDSFDGDSLCVTPERRQMNHDANPHRQPGGGAYGPNTCEPGYVWRNSYDGDVLCVTPAERER
ncbi:hypothetical protein [Streptomyces sp. NPDC057686]|uniref:hypothetical protein n=1 Tax=Streptomyces sp. NPDC057686 TaxID=3346212 RepID=UPI00367CF676